MFPNTLMSFNPLPPPTSRNGMIFPTRKEYINSCKSQQFPFLNSIMDYILKSPKSIKLYQKLIQSCKILFLKNPILIIFVLEFRIKSNGKESWHYGFEKRCGFFLDSEEIDMKNNMSKLWITEGLRITDNGGNGNIKNLIPKLYQCDAINLSLMGINIGFMNLKHLSKRVKNFDANYSSIVDEKGELLTMEDILEVFSNAENFFRQETKCPSSITYKRKIDQNIFYWKMNNKDYTDDSETSDNDSSSEDSEMNEDIYGEDSEISKETTSDVSEMSTDSEGIF
uniref:Uncharacterized protein n=1 Tax=Panagrolaimus davidi TaxID=227884 RepID=A0A914PRT0_9BILA